MKRFFLLNILFVFVSIATFAGGILTNTNQNIAFLRNPARDASTRIDAVYSNPAGLAFLKDGFHISLNGQSAFQTRTIKTTYAPFVGNGGSSTKTFKGEASAPFVPSIQAAYKKDKWAFSGSFAITGGGGKATFNDGLGSFESQVAVLPNVANSVLTKKFGKLEEGTYVDKYSVDSYMQGRQYIFGLQLGATYKFTDFLSGFFGLRMNYVSNSYLGHIRDIRINPNLPQVGFDGSMISATDFINVAAEAGMLSAQEAIEYREMVKDKELDCDQKGWGVTPILGIDFKWEKWNVGVKYEFNTKLNVENKTKIDDTKLFQDGVNTPHDIPSLLTVGVSYELLPVLSLSVGYHHFFDKNAKMADDKQKHLKHGTHEFLGGVEWDILDWLQISGGLQRTKYGLSDAYLNDMSFIVNSWTYGFGAGFKLTKDLFLNIAYFQTQYGDYTKVTNNFNGTGMPLTDVFTRTNKVFGIGLDYSF